jgi:hypothetical protein
MSEICYTVGCANPRNIDGYRRCEECLDITAGGWPSFDTPEYVGGDL